MKNDYANKNGKQNTARKPSSVGEKYDAPFRGYVNVNLSPEQKETYVAWSNSESFWDWLQSSVEDGVNLSLKLDPKGSGYLGSATQRRSSSPNAGLVVTARGDTAAKALGRTLFCLAILGQKERWEDTAPVADPDRW